MTDASRGRPSAARFAATAASLLAAYALAAAVDASPADKAAHASALARAGDFAAALPFWREAASGYGAAGNARARAAALLELARAQHVLGQHQESLAALDAARAAGGADASAAQLAAIHGTAAQALLALGSLARASEELERALTLTASAAPSLRAALLNTRGNLASAGADFASATRDYAESAALAESAGDRLLAARAEANRARALLRAQASSVEVCAALARAEARAADLSPHDAIAVALSVGRSYAQLAERAGPESVANAVRAHAALTRAQSAAEAAGDARGASYALGYLGALYEHQGRRDEALALTRRALFAAQSAQAPESLYRWHWQAGRLLRASGDREAAIAAYRQALGVLQQIRFELAQSAASGEGSFHEAVGRAFFELVDLLLATAPEPAETAAHQARLAEVRETLERLKAAELRDYFRDECVDQLAARTEQLDQVAKNAIVIYPVVLADRLELLLTFPKGLRRETVAVRGDDLSAEASSLRALLEKRTTREYLPHAQRLYDWLVRPIEVELAGLGVDTLVFVPDGALRTIPLSALHDGERFLIERYAVAVTPGLSLTDPRPLARENLEVFTGGLSAAVQGFPALAQVPHEVASIRGLFGGEALLDEEFRLPRVERALAEHDFGIVHIATHAQFPGDARDSFLLTYDGRITLDRLGEAVGRTRFRERPIELLTLSACETAQSDERAALGLAGVAVQSGARSALGTLWSVNDEAAATLIGEFYRELRNGPVSKAVALKRAQQKLLADPSRRHPFYWSAFLLINNWL